MEDFTDEEQSIVSLSRDLFIGEIKLLEPSLDSLITIISKLVILLDSKDTTPESEYEKAKREYDAFVKRVRGRNAS